MHRLIRNMFCLTLISLESLPATLASAKAPRDLASETRAIFAAQCAGCHGPELPRPKGRFGYVLDLKRVASNPEMVVPYSPDESELWQLVRRNEMPPEDASTGPLSEQQKAVIRAWIAAGASAHPVPHRRTP